MVSAATDQSVTLVVLVVVELVLVTWNWDWKELRDRKASMLTPFTRSKCFGGSWSTTMGLTDP